MCNNFESLGIQTHFIDWHIVSKFRFYFYKISTRIPIHILRLLKFQIHLHISCLEEDSPGSSLEDSQRQQNNNNQPALIKPILNPGRTAPFC